MIKYPKISVIIPAYNHEKYIGRCLRSVFDQSINEEDYEIIVINDGSKDNTKEIIGKFLNKIVYMENKINRGLPYSLNKGIKKAKGKYIVRLDSDDYVNRDFLLILYLFLNQNINFDAVSCDYIIVDDNEKVIKREDSQKKPIGCAIMFKTDDLIKIGLYNKNFKLHEDKELMERFKKHFNVTRIPLPLYRYRQHSKNITSNVKNDKFYKSKLKNEKKKH